MIKTDDGCLAVFTKYDSIFMTVIEPHLPPLVAHSLMDNIELSPEPIDIIEVKYSVHHTETGLEGVKFVRYKEVIHVT